MSDEVSEELWRGAWVSAVIRALRADPSALTDVRGVRRFPALPTPAAEASFLECVGGFYLRGDVVALPVTEGECAVMLEEDEADALGATISRHFISEQRNAVAVGFFSQLLNSVRGRGCLGRSLLRSTIRRANRVDAARTSAVVHSRRNARNVSQSQWGV